MKKSMFILLLLCTMIAVSVTAETFVYSDTKFPYKITAKQEWETVAKDDTLFEMKKKGTGKVAHLKVKKYLIDTAFDPSTLEWSRWSFAVNKEYANQIGTLGYFDSTVSKKIGNLRAYEIYSYYNLDLEGKKVRWAQYDRWAESSGIGFLVSVVADSVDMTTNYSVYKTMLDSMNLEAEVNRIHIQSISEYYETVNHHTKSRGAFYTNLLGRTSKAITVNQVYIQMISRKCSRLTLW